MGVAKLLTFTIGNYRSFYAPQTLDLLNDDGTPRTLTVIYGPNSSGKSNLMCALQDFRACVINSSAANWKLPYLPFMLRQGSQGRPTSFTALFEVDGVRYRYSFSYTADRIVEEELKATSPKTGRLNFIFRRDENGVSSKNAGKYGFDRDLVARTRQETLLITKAREDNNPYADVVFRLVQATPVMLDWSGDYGPAYVEMLKTNEDLRAKILKLLKNCDFAIRDIAIGEIQISEEAVSAIPLPIEAKRALLTRGATTFSTLHAIRDDELSIVGQGALDFWSQESNGTRKFFEMAVPIVSALETGQTLFLDEYGTYLHPNLAKALVSLFKGAENKTGACLVVNTQGTELMGDIAERDDIVLVEKGMAEESRVASLKSRGARTTEPLERRYLKGLYGAVPRVRER